MPNHTDHIAAERGEEPPRRDIDSPDFPSQARDGPSQFSRDTNSVEPAEQASPVAFEAVAGDTPPPSAGDQAGSEAPAPEPEPLLGRSARGPDGQLPLGRAPDVEVNADAEDAAPIASILGFLGGLF